MNIAAFKAFWRLYFGVMISLSIFDRPARADENLGAPLPKTPEAQAFAAYLSDSQCVKNLVFEISTYPSVPRGPEIQVLPIGVIVNFRTNTYSIIWQSNAFWLEQVPRKQQVVTNYQGQLVYPDSHLILGFLPGRMWYLRGDQMTYYNGDMGTQDTNPPGSIYVLNLSYLRKSLEAIYLGISGLKPGTLKWAGSQWDGESTSGQQMHGSVRFDEKGQRPLEMRYEIKGTREKWTVEYLYDGDPIQGDSLPWHFRRTKAAYTNTDAGLVEVDICITNRVLSSASVQKNVENLEVSKSRAILHAWGTPLFEQTTNGTF